ncbi:ATP11-domain-containing protein [Neolentinus lepideus HHB14362 ss-1]|uniref:ATP11-domain-containing protein n=1 Tax=Neolentinus lepideus HHB14362 ss-1 TaxID=1314782 RepID=A0A165RGN3_9AGAM|nr:ATP11-domain-containing protein [Neolentinus lepideus HHB14362 ss-1]
MYSLWRRSLLPSARNFSLGAAVPRRLLQHQPDYDAKYAEKLARVAQERGTSVEGLRAKLKEEELERRRQALASSARQKQPSSTQRSDASSEHLATPSSNVRKDSSPVKPLSTFLNLSKLFQSPHTSEQVSALWTAYHLSRSQGTGRGYICASIPVDTYHRMTGIAKKYSSFIIPVPREQEGEGERAYEFYFMQWGFHESPDVPSVVSETNPFAAKQGGNSQVSTVLFTPLQEYKLRQAFATPYLVLTHYTDLAETHGVVLLRGEITPSAAAPVSSGAGQEEAKYLLSQVDAQVLAMSLQRFYLWNAGEGAMKEKSKEREALLRRFHENPAEFKWEDLLKHTDLTA